MTDILLSTKNLAKTYQMGEVQVHALRGVDLEVRNGEFIAIMGASGSGKTTLMNLLGCLDHSSTGEYILDGIPVHQMDDDELTVIRNQKIGYVFQSFYLLPRTTALENVELPLLYCHKCNTKERHEKARQALEIVGISERAHHYPNQLSGGQQQRVAIARAIVHQPRIIFADELTGNLDSRTTHDIMLSLQATVKKQGQTLLMVTHDRDVANYADRIIFMVDGKIVSEEQGRK